jgi:hypothetical protein
MRKIILEESKVIEAIGIILAIALSMSVLESSFVERLVLHWNKLAITDGISIISSECKDSFANICIFQLMHEIVTIDSIVFLFFGANLTITHKDYY